MTTILEQGNISIHTENIFPIIKKWLYSDHEIFMRELISNAVDAIKKVSMVSRSGELQGDIGEPEILITIDKVKKTLSITDTGIGMTAEEVKKYITQVAFSSAEEFVDKYKAAGDEQIIGHFGLGFYSSFMVASQVEIDTLSYREGAQAVHWTCDGSTSFTISDSDRTTRGTTITLTLQEEEQEYLEDYRIRTLVKTYCDFMPFPIKLEVIEPPKPATEAPKADGEAEAEKADDASAEASDTADTSAETTTPEVEVAKPPEQINKQKALWKESPSSLTDEDYLEFYRYLYPYQEDPLLWVHLNTDYPFVVNGILYFPKLKPDVDVTKSSVKLFCNQVFVSDNCEEVIPRFLLPLRGVIDSSDIPLNVSRSFLQADRTVKQIGNYVAKKVGDRLKEQYRDDRQAYIKSWEDLGTFVKFGSMNDDKFKKQVEDILIFRTSLVEQSEAPKVEVETADGDVWTDKKSSNTVDGRTYTTLQEYLDRNKEQHENRVFYCTDEVTQATYVNLYKGRGIEVLFLDSFIDSHFATFLEQEYREVKFARVDADLDDSLIEKDKSEVIDPTTNKTFSDRIKDIFTGALSKPKLTIRTESIKSDDPASAPPAMVLLPEEQRRMQEMMAMMQQQQAEFPEEHILLLNTSHPLIQNLSEINKGAIEGTESTASELSGMICHHIYDLALMAQKGFDADGMKDFVERSNQVLTQLTAKK
ncbi:molecular chaperone HtpG [filamentous cyanobacterium LEGE 11480]|uniref:Molecular chaperone HtpG n=1 Tax=Romeriopsis navalis LEGE 11480 TaxID=2777977 RepID=A0A928VHB8_9CYAN|nr:molecular chaperone HtpG [Romeriopsis navalis]MBE9028335.1 molecular chaperone HtpG [Romeriopsis navalis LEGE 11480]